MANVSAPIIRSSHMYDVRTNISQNVFLSVLQEELVQWEKVMDEERAIRLARRKEQRKKDRKEKREKEKEEQRQREIDEKIKKGDLMICC